MEKWVCRGNKPSGRICGCKKDRARLQYFKRRRRSRLCVSDHLKYLVASAKLLDSGKLKHADVTIKMARWWVGREIEGVKEEVCTKTLARASSSVFILFRVCIPLLYRLYTNFLSLFIHIIFHFYI